MLGRLVKQFVKRGARDHLSARRVQEEADLHRLFVLTAFQRAEGDGPELVQRVMAEGKDLQFDELKAEVTSNLTEQAHRACAAVRDALAEARRGQGAGTSRASPSARLLSEGVLRRLGFAPRVAPSGAGPNSGDGLFVRGEVNPGEIVAWYPGLVYDLENVRHIPGYPKVAERNPYLAARYDGSVVDAKPWGAGGAAVDVDMEARIGVRSSTARENDEDDQTRFGSWPGPPLEENDSAPSSEETSPETKKRSGVGGFLDAQLAPELDPGLRSEARAAALGVQRDNPLALAHFANHPPKGYRPNVVVAGVDVAFRGDQVASLARSCRTRRSGDGLRRRRASASQRRRLRARSAAGSRPGCTTCSGKRTRGKTIFPLVPRRDRAETKARRFRWWCRRSRSSRRRRSKTRRCF